MLKVVYKNTTFIHTLNNIQTYDHYDSNKQGKELEQLEPNP